MKDSLRVSIIIPVFNGSEYLAEAINSALNQTYKNIEVLVINDGSTDGGKTEEIALSFGESIRYIKKKNGGVASALNLSLDYMTGDYFSWLSHDDLYTNDKIELEIKAMNENVNKNTIIYSDYTVFYTNKKQSIPVKLRCVPPNQFRYSITISSFLHGCTLLIPTSAFAECGKFNESLRTTQDYDLWFRMAKKFDFVHIPHSLVLARNHSAQGSVTMADIASVECNSLLAGFVRELTPEELKTATGQSLAVAYAGIASSMWRRSFLPAGQLAASLSIYNINGTRFLDGLRAISILASGRFMHYLKRITKQILELPSRFSIENIFKATLSNKDNLNLKTKFSNVYENNLFKGRISRSGEGSDLVQTATIRSRLPRLIEELNIQKLLDAPCGDWYWMREVDLCVDEYLGVDIVDELIKKNQFTHGNKQISFQCLNLATDALPKSDLILCRDCLVHLSFDDALEIISNFKHSGATYLLTTTFSKRMRNEDLGSGFWRPLNLQLPPFNFPPPIILINENCTEENGQYSDKSLALWHLDDIKMASNRLAD